MIKVGTVCTGIGSPEQAMKELKIPHEITFSCEIDKYARASYLANFSPKTMYDDMTKEKWDLPGQYVDLFFGGIPCQAFSLAGKRLGELDPRGLLFFDYYRYVKNQRPKVFGIENVKGLLSDNKGKTFQNWLLLLGNSVNGHTQMFNHPDSLCYNMYWAVLNTKDFGLPQNRERVFIIGIRPDVDDGNFRFPKGVKLEKRLKDVLENNVDQKYYLSKNALEYLSKPATGGYSDRLSFLNNENNDVAGCITANHSKGVPYNCMVVNEAKTLQGNTITNTIRTGGKGSLTDKHSWDVVIVPEATKQGHAIVETEKWIRGGLQQNQLFQTNGISPCLTSAMGMGGGQTPIHNYDSRIRRLTPLECWRLQGFPDESFYNAKNADISDTQLYKQAGNSISVPVIKAIINNISYMLCQ